MEQVRFVLAIVLSFLVFFVWNYFFVPEKKVENNIQTTAQEIKKEEKKVVLVSENSKALALKEISSDSKSSDFITVETPLYSINISKKGAVFISALLKKYKKENVADSSLKNLVDVKNNIPLSLFHLNFMNDSVKNFSNAVFTSSVKTKKIIATSKSKKISFFWESYDGIKIEKEFVFYPDSYLIDFNLNIYNKSGQKIQDSIAISLLNDVEAKKGRSFVFEGASALIGEKVLEADTKDVDEENTFSGNIKWVAFQSRYFMSAIIPEKETKATLNLFLNNGILETQYLLDIPVIHPSSIQKHKFKFFIGPKSVTILNKMDYELKKSVNFGFFDFIAKPLLIMMNYLYVVFHNYGIAIILLTLLTKLIFFPLGTKSYKSMNEMKKLQPIIAEIRTKYKDDKKKRDTEIMSLHKTYKINPLGGCLPIVVQIPIFFALYKMLYGAIELRHAPFFGWITDLSAPDRLFHFSFSIPFMQEPSGIPVLTILMGLSMFFQQKLTPTTGDSTQAKIMLLMPIIMTFVFINFSSGLVLYWLINNILSIAQQYYVTQKAKK